MQLAVVEGAAFGRPHPTLAAPTVQTRDSVSRV